MEIGTVEPVLDSPEARRRIQSLGGSAGSGNGQNGGGDDGDHRDFAESQDRRADKAKFVTWFLLLVVLMTFGGLIGAYIVVATNGAAEWRPFALPIQTWISTGLIILSSVAYHIGKTALFDDEFSKARKFFVGTAVLGATFISSQILVWLALVNRGFYLKGNPYAGFFYILTAIHAIHVMGGIIALGTTLLRTWHPTNSLDEYVYRRNLARSVGWYWHFMGALWIVLFVLLGFWK